VPYFNLACHIFIALAEEGFIHSGDDRHLSELDTPEAAARHRDAAAIIAATIEQELPRVGA
jgi:hypothetical protein